MKDAWIILILMSTTAAAIAQGQFAETELLKTAYILMLDLKLEEGRALCQRSRVEDPDNLLVEHIDSYADFISAFITEEKVALDSMEERKSRRLEAIKAGDRSSPYYHYSQGEIYLQWAIARSKHGAYIKAGWDINRAYKLLRKCKAEHPDFVLADKSLSVIHALMGSISGFQKSMIKLFTALDGSTAQGIAEIDGLYQRREDLNSLWDTEIVIVSALMGLHVERDNQAALDYLLGLDPSAQRLTLVRYFIGSALQKLGRSDEAQAYFCINQPDDALPFYYMDLQCGVCRLNGLEEGADEPIRRFVDSFQGINYVTEGYQKLAWYALAVEDDTIAYRQWMMKAKSKGIGAVGEDEQALLEAHQDLIPDRHLLMARLSYDGGYYEAAQEQLIQIDMASLDPADVLEYHYRSGRVYHALERYDEAILSYARTIQLGINERVYYACMAALQTAEIFRDKQEDQRAAYYYQQCLDISPSTFRESLHQRARLGLQYLSERR